MCRDYLAFFTAQFVIKFSPLYLKIIGSEFDKLLLSNTITCIIFQETNKVFKLQYRDEILYKTLCLMKFNARLFIRNNGCFFNTGYHAIKEASEIRKMINEKESVVCMHGHVIVLGKQGDKKK